MKENDVSRDPVLAFSKHGTLVDWVKTEEERSKSALTQTFQAEF